MRRLLARLRHGGRADNGRRRRQRLPVTGADVRDVAGDLSSIEVRFDLPRGSYATIVLAEIMKAN